MTVSEQLQIKIDFMKSKINDTQEQIQQDILTRFDYLNEIELDLLCQIVVDNFKALK